MAKRRTSKRVPGEPAEAPPEQDEGEPIVVGEEETITGDDLGDEVPGTPGQGGSKGRRTPTPGRAGRGSGGRPRTPGRPGSGGEARGRGGRGAPAGSSPRNTGAEIGRLHRRGMSLAVKFSLFISLLIILISSLFGLVVIKLFKETVQKEIIHSGYLQVLSLEPFAKNAFQKWRDFENNKNRPERSFDETPESKEMKEQLLKIVEGDPRIKDIAVFASRNESPSPSGVVAAAKSPKTFVPAPDDDNELKGVTVFAGEADPRVMVWESEYRGENENVGEPVFFFGLPIQGSRRAMSCSLNLILTK